MIDDDDVPILLNLDTSDDILSTPSLVAINNNNEQFDPTSHHNVQQQVNDVNKKVPVTILSGFLGSGKTTLIQYILKSPNHGKRIAVIENEFSGGASSIDDTNNLLGNSALNIETLIARDGVDDSNLTDLIELPNGCICCTVKDSLVSTLEQLINKRSNLDYILIECSGMANPGPIASIFWLDETLESRIRLDGIITCVDARNIEMQLKETSSLVQQHTDENNSTNSVINGGDEAAQQIAFADRIILNKVDLLQCQEQDQKIELDKRIHLIRQINNTAPIRITSYSEIPDLEWILDTNCFSADKALEIEASLSLIGQERGELMNRMGCPYPNCSSCEILSVDGKYYNQEFCIPCQVVENHLHTNSITSIALVQQGSVSLKKMHLWLASILWPDQDAHDKVLKAQLEKLEMLNQITTPELIEQSKLSCVSGKMQIFRIKGILSVKHPIEDLDDENFEHSIESTGLDNRKHIVQAVNDLWDINPASTSHNWDDEKCARICKLVVIGRYLNQSELSKGFQTCFEV